ncbi:MAG: hypothetical protein Q7J34_08560 [Bacteroidales bacterium]|nr:hypothetical protein [Bacteroidales bacterium]
METKIKLQTVYQSYYVDDTHQDTSMTQRHKRSETEYDASGKIVTDIQYDQNGLAETKTLNTYDKSGNLIRSEVYDFVEDVSEVFETEWNEKGQKLTEKKIYTDGSFDLSRWEYDTHFFSIKKTTYDPDNEIEQIVSFIHVENKIQKEITKDSDGEIILEDEYEYDIHGNVILHIHSSIEEGYSRTEHQYNESGKRIFSVSTDEDGDVIEKTKIEELEDGSGISMTEESSAGIAYYKISNDETGRMLQQEEYNEDNTLISSIQRQYLPNGHISRTLGMMYRPEYDTEQYYSIDYKYDFFEN